jgi:hypothetical protein
VKDAAMSPGRRARSIHPMTGVRIEVRYADRSVETFGWRGDGWFEWPRWRVFSPQRSAIGPFATSYAACRHVLVARERAADQIGREQIPSEPAITNLQRGIQIRGMSTFPCTMLPYCFQRAVPWKHRKG